jgi:hypothetical protein
MKAPYMKLPEEDTQNNKLEINSRVPVNPKNKRPREEVDVQMSSDEEMPEHKVNSPTGTKTFYNRPPDNPISWPESSIDVTCVKCKAKSWSEPKDKIKDSLWAFWVICWILCWLVLPIIALLIIGCNKSNWVTKHYCGVKECGVVMGICRMGPKQKQETKDERMDNYKVVGK